MQNAEILSKSRKISPAELENPENLNFSEFHVKIDIFQAITIEPGCYFIDFLLNEALADPKKSEFLVKSEIDKYRGSGGVRIEDDVIIRASGNENLSDLPRTVEEIENFMASGGEWTEKVIESRVSDFLSK